MNLTRRFLLASTAYGLIAAKAYAWPVHGQVFRTTGTTQISGFPDTVGNGNSFAFSNLTKMMTSWQCFGDPTLDVPAYLDDEGWAATAPTSTIQARIPITGFPSTGRFVLKWAGTRTGGYRLSPVQSPNTGLTVHSVTAGSVIGSTAFTLLLRGTGARCVFSFNGVATDFDMMLIAGETYSGSGELIVCREEDEARIDAGDIWNPDFVNFVRVMNPATIRTMDWCRVNNGINPQFAKRWPVTAASFVANRFPTAARVGGGGGLAGTNTYTCSAPGDWSGLVDGADGWGYVGNSSTAITISAAADNGSGLIRLTVNSTAVLSTNQQVAVAQSNGPTTNGPWAVTVIDATHLDLQGSAFTSSFTGTISYATLNVAGTGAKLFLSPLAGAISLSASASVYFQYNSKLDCYYGDQGGSAAGFPVEILYSMANKIGVNLWINFPDLWTSASRTAATIKLRDNMRGDLLTIVQPSNELFNTFSSAFTQGFRQYVYGRTLGYPDSDGRRLLSTNGLLSRQMFGDVVSAWQPRTRSNLYCMLGVWAVQDTAATQTYAMNGGDLASFGYNSSPNRPIDYADSFCYGTYFSGAQCLRGWGGETSTGLNTGGPSNTGLLGAASDYGSGNATLMANALAFVDFDLRQGTRSGVAGSETLLALATGFQSVGYYPRWETIAASYDGARPAGKSNLKVDEYEGGCEIIAPTTAQCTSMSIANPGTVSANIAALFTAYKLDVSFFTLTKDYYGAFAAKAHSRWGSWFNIVGDNQWSMMQSSIYQTPYFKSYYGTASYNG